MLRIAQIAFFIKWKMAVINILRAKFSEWMPPPVFPALYQLIPVTSG